MKNTMHLGHFRSAVLPELIFSQSRTRVRPHTGQTSNNSRGHVLLRQETKGVSAILEDRGSKNTKELLGCLPTSANQDKALFHPLVA